MVNFASLVDLLDLLVNFILALVGTVISKVSAAVWPGHLDFNNIQGDIIVGLPKKVERFIFLQIVVPSRFRKNLSRLVPTITTTSQVIHDRTQIDVNKEQSQYDGAHPPLLPLSGTNIAFSQYGLKRLGITGFLADRAFKKGQKAHAYALGDPYNPSDSSDPNWLPEFKENIDVVLLVTGATWERVAERIVEIESIFGIGTADASVRQVFALDGNVRPGEHKGYEHFGFRDGISQPAIIGFGKRYPGQEAVPAGIALCRNSGDPWGLLRPRWSTDGSFLVFRYLEQLVPEFNEYLVQNPVDGLPRDRSSALLGARMVGRWKSGAPLDISPDWDNPALGKDLERNNNFDYSTDPTQTRCPFAAHIRKSNPRSDQALLGGTTVRRIWRQGIAFGREVTHQEREQQRTLHSRGLAFVCYQSSIDNGFSFIQRGWCNNILFPIKLFPLVVSGFDPIIGLNRNHPRDTFDPAARDMDLRLNINFVVPKGGEYFFAPSIRALREVFSQKA